jgi:hypothetical protein
MSLVNVNDNLLKNEKIKSLVASQCSIKNCAEVILPRCVSGQERLQANKILLLQCMIYGTQALFDLYKDGELLEDADAVIELRSAFRKWYMAKKRRSGLSQPPVYSVFGISSSYRTGRCRKAAYFPAYSIHGKTNAEKGRDSKRPTSAGLRYCKNVCKPAAR